MRKQIIGSLIALASALAVSQIALAQENGARRGDHSQTASSQPFDPHDLSGIWDLRSRDLEVSTDVPPMTAEGKAKFDANKPSYGPRAVPPAEGNDPMGNCDPLGMPRLLFYAAGVEFVQTKEKTIQLFQWHEAWRNIWTDGRELPKLDDTIVPQWMGYSVGHWDGDTFVIDSDGFDDRTWLDHFGDPHSDQMRVEERWQRVDHDTLHLNLTVTDPVMYSKPWVSDTKIFKLDPNQHEMTEMFCVPSEEQAFNRRIRDLADGKHDQAPSH